MSRTGKTITNRNQARYNLPDKNQTARRLFIPNLKQTYRTLHGFDELHIDDRIRSGLTIK